MKTFNKYGFLEDLKTDLLDDVKNGYLTDTNEIWDYIHSYLDNSVIYYQDCFLICMELNFTDFTSHELGEASNICQAAYFALYDLVNDEFEQTEIEEAIEFKQLEQN
jgi:hypothetical protein